VAWEPEDFVGVVVVVVDMLGGVKGKLGESGEHVVSNDAEEGDLLREDDAGSWTDEDRKLPIGGSGEPL
jgi:hypothetical protein